MHGRGVCMVGGMHGREHVQQGHAWQGACAAGDMHGRGMHGGGNVWQGDAWWGECVAGGAYLAGKTAIAAGGTHPTEMHFC